MRMTKEEGGCSRSSPGWACRFGPATGKVEPEQTQKSYRSIRLQALDEITANLSCFVGRFIDFRCGRKAARTAIQEVLPT